MNGAPKEPGDEAAEAKLAEIRDCRFAPDSGHLPEMTIAEWRRCGPISDARGNNLCQHCQENRLPNWSGFGVGCGTIDKLRSYAAAFQHLGLSCHHERDLRQNNRAENPQHWCDGASARCNASNQRHRHNGS